VAIHQGSFGNASRSRETNDKAPEAAHNAAFAITLRRRARNEP
jgi:hypothetical protein